MQCCTGRKRDLKICVALCAQKHSLSHVGVTTWNPFWHWATVASWDWWQCMKWFLLAPCNLSPATIFFLAYIISLSTHDECEFTRHLFLPLIGPCLLDNFVLPRGWVVTGGAIHCGPCRNRKDISGIQGCKAWALIMKCHVCECICGT